MPARTMPQLFKQLGLPSDEASMERFIAQSDGVSGVGARLQTPIWSEAQQIFLQEAVAQDSDWSIKAEALLAAMIQRA